MPVHDLKPDEEYLIGVFWWAPTRKFWAICTICLATRIQSTSTPRMMVRCASKGGSTRHHRRHAAYVHLQPEDLISRYLDKIVRAELTSDERGAFLNELKQG